MPEFCLPVIFDKAIDFSDSSKKTAKYRLMKAKGLAWLKGHFPEMSTLTGVGQHGIELNSNLNRWIRKSAIYYRIYDVNVSYTSGNIVLKH